MSLVARIARALGSGKLTLFTGAGFSNEATDHRRVRLPTARQLRRELWDLCFPDTKPDESTLADLFHHALRRKPRQLARLVDERLRIDPASLGPEQERWFALPWRRIYTLNVDDLEVAVAERFALPHTLVPISALTGGRRRKPRRSTIEVIHLNGVVADGPEGITFSTLQYGDRLARRCAFYEELARDLRTHPFLIVGTQLGEAPLWQHVQMLARRHGRRRARSTRSWLVAERLDRARQSLLRELGIEWIRMSAGRFARDVLSKLPL